MSRYTLRPREGSTSFHKITTGRRWVGRVCPHGDGGWMGVIGRLTVRAPTPEAAFEEVVAQHLGYPSADALRAKNQEVRQVRRMASRAGDQAVHEMLRSNMRPVEQMLGHPLTASALLNAFTRDLRRRRG